MALHVGPHPDDEALGAPGTLLLLHDEGWRIVNLACSLGRADEVDRRRAELTESCRRLGFELVLPPADGTAASADLAASVRRAVHECLTTDPVQVVVAPNPHDDHPVHEEVGRAVVAALRSAPRDVRLWTWRLWGDLSCPTLVVPLEESHVRRAEGALAAHAGEVGRNDFIRVLRARATAAPVLDAERALGYGASPPPLSYAEVLTEVFVSRGARALVAAEARVLDRRDPLTPARPSGRDLAPLWDSPSGAAQVRRSHTRP